MLYLVEPGLVLIAFVAFSFLLIAVLRGRYIPQCFQCGATKVRPSRPLGVLELAAAFLLVRPYRCLGCRTRFHAMRLFSRSRHDPNVSAGINRDSASH